MRGAWPEAPIEGADAAAAPSPFVQIADQQYRTRSPPAWRERLVEGGDQAIGLQSPLAGVQAKMGSEHAQHSIPDRQIGIERRARLVIRYGEVNRAGGEHRKAGQNGIGKAPATAPGAGAEDHLAARCFGKISRLIAMQSAVAPGIDLLQTGDVGVDLTQHGCDPRRVVPAVDSDASMDVVGYHTDRR